MPHPSTPTPSSPTGTITPTDSAPLLHALDDLPRSTHTTPLISNPSTPYHPPPNSPDSSFGRSPARVIGTVPRTRPHRSLDGEMYYASNPTKLPKTSTDFRALTYLSTVDENLMCPICRMVLVEPVDTECEHTFCKECITEALVHSELCPIDRIPCSTDPQFKPSHKIIINQLDALLVECPDCDEPVPRALLRNHLERYCKVGRVPCPEKTRCRQLVPRCLAEEGKCLHYDVSCPDCEEVCQKIDLLRHREILCKAKEKYCDFCGIDIIRCKESEHMRTTCTEIDEKCKWAEYGCEYFARRKYHDTHATECAFKSVGPMADMLKKEISNLCGEVRTLNEKSQLQERRIKFLEGGQRDTYGLDYSEIPSQGPSSLPDATNPDSLDSTTLEYLVNLIGDQDRRLDQLVVTMKELEAKQAMMLFNETINIKNELGEMRSTQQVQGMHIRWLMQFRRQENQQLQQNQQKRFGGSSSASNAESYGGGSSQDSPIIRRLSDSTRDLITKL
jgi:TNF receptor-associated factor 5